MLSKIKNMTVEEGSNLFAVSPLRFLIILFCTSLSLRAESRSGIITIGDSLKNKYDINDPRNPHCPCHQYQKLADEEYARLQNKQKNKTLSSPNEELLNVRGDTGNQNVRKDFFLFSHKKRKINKRKGKTSGHRTMNHKISDKLSRCFHF